MGRLIAVIGNTAAGKTTLVRRLAAVAPFATGLEEHAERPFQRAFAEDLAASGAGGYRHALANQIDYLLLRGEQEAAIRNMPGSGLVDVGLVDGGLDEDYYVFTRHFHRLGYLNAAEFALCTRLYHFVRQTLPDPDLFILLHAPLNVLAARYARRNRTVEIAKLEELRSLQALVDDWAAAIPPERLLTVDVSAEDAFDEPALHMLLHAIEARLSLRQGALVQVP